LEEATEGEEGSHAAGQWRTAAAAGAEAEPAADSCWKAVATEVEVKTAARKAAAARQGTAVTQAEIRPAATRQKSEGCKVKAAAAAAAAAKA
jgi:hypothetical protein